MVSTRNRKITHVVAGAAVGMAVFCLIALPTCITVSSWHVPWGVALTVPVCLVGFYLGAIPTMKKVIEWFEVREEQKRMLERARALAAELGPVTEAELLELRKVWPPE